MLVSFCVLGKFSCQIKFWLSCIFSLLSIKEMFKASQIIGEEQESL